MESELEIRSRRSHGLFGTFLVIAYLSGLAIEYSGIFKRAELQTINQRFEARNWLRWTPASLDRLNLPRLLAYHEKHEIPRRWHAWDYTLSWLIENNHPPIKHKFIIFNHQLEDEPPPEAAVINPWMKPLLKWPLPRASIASSLEFLAKSKVKLIILDNDFPQYSPDDARLAMSIHKCDTGAFAGYKVPVLMARTVNRSTSTNLLKVEVPTSPSGVLAELKKLEPGVDVLKKYTGSTGVWIDQDQVVRSLASNIRGHHGEDYESIATKAATALGELKDTKLPNPLIIDYAGPPNSYPVRPYTYLLDPQRQKEMVKPSPGSTDVTLKDAIVILGDGVVDVYSTSTTNFGYNFMSGPEILANAIDTISRKSWPTQVSGLAAVNWLFLNALVAAAIAALWRSKLVETIRKNDALPGDYSLKNLLSDLVVIVFTMSLSVLAACLLFAYAGLIVPVIAPLVAIIFGTVASIAWEREKERMETMCSRIQAAEEKLVMMREIHRVDLQAQAAHAKAREFLKEHEQRVEFLHKINHDLRGPVGVLNWTIMRLQKDGLHSPTAPQKIERLANSADRLSELLDELMLSYEIKQTAPEREQTTTDLNSVASDCCKLQSSLAEERNSNITCTLSDIATVSGRPLEISRCIDNLTRNALLHNKPGTNVSISVIASDSFHSIVVADDGKGISRSDLNHIFDAGYRIKQNAESHKDGKGLGLHIVKELIESMGGTIKVESTVGEGTRFTLTLPATKIAEVDRVNDMAPKVEKVQEEICA
ncbi:MAG: CHASE2 domain-containing protein [Cyanobacteria bacterium SZAS-4]|nr:CHASE2 domain-containing protein [Cyanobacteria bacterium SZAS-4]